MKIVRIDWLDSHEVSHWTHLRDLPPIEPEPIVSIGMLLGETDHAVRVTGHLGVDADKANEQACGIMTIPRCCIVSMVVIGDTDSPHENFLASVTRVLHDPKNSKRRKTSDGLALTQTQ